MAVGYVVEVENRPVWDPLDFDHSLLPSSKVVSNLQIIQIAISLFMNGLVIFVALVKRHLLSNAANLLTVIVSACNFIFGLYLLSVRIRLIIDFQWSQPFCAEFGFVVILFVCIGAFNLTGICLERYLALVKLIRVSRKHALIAVGLSVVTSIILTTLHYIPYGTAFIGRAGIYCCPTRVAGWQGAMNVMALIVHFIAIFAGYFLIYMQLRRLSRNAKASMNVPTLGPTTMGNLGHSRSIAPRGNQVASVHSSQSSRNSKQAPTRSDQRAPTILETASMSGAETLGSSVGGGTVASKRLSIRSRSMSVSSLRSMVTLPTRPESRVVLRGMLSLLTYVCFVVSYSYVMLLALVEQDRPSVVFDWFLVSTKFLSDIGDPIILFVLDRQFQQALKEVLGFASPT